MADAFRRLVATGRRERDDDFDLTGYTLLVNSLFSSPASIIPGGIAGILTPFLCWVSTRHEVFIQLTLLVALVVVLRLVTLIAYRRRNHAKDSYAETRRWDRDYFLGATAFSAVLGYSCYVALVRTDDAAAHITSVSSTIALASGYVARNAGRPKFVAVQLLTFCIPMAIGLIGANNPYYKYIGFSPSYMWRRTSRSPIRCIATCSPSARRPSSRRRWPPPCTRRT
ncbi:hypothetical protein [Bosea sp. (in: a-proteobacteria)]